MARIKISGSASVTVDGKVVSNTGSFVCEVDDVAEYTTDVYGTYVPLSKLNTKNVFYIVANNGLADAVVRVTGSTGTYSMFPVPVGGHVVIPMGGSTDTGTQATWTNLYGRAVTGFTRLYVMVGHHA